MTRPSARFRLPIALLLLAASASGLLAATATVKQGASRPTTTAVAPTSAASAAAPGSSAAEPAYHKENRTPMGLRDIPGRVIIAEILTWDPQKKTMHVKNLRNEEFDLVFDEKTDVQSKDPLKVGDMIRTRFVEKDGRNIPVMIRVLDAPKVQKAKESLSNPGDKAYRPASGQAAPAGSSAAPASASSPAKK